MDNRAITPNRSAVIVTFVLATVLVLGGIALLVYGWWRVSGEARAAEQIPYLASTSIPGAALLVIGAVTLLRAGASSRDPRVDALLVLLTEPVPEGQTGKSPVGKRDHVVVDGASHFHRPDCALVAGKHVQPFVDSAATGAGTHAACPLCIEPT